MRRPRILDLTNRPGQMTIDEEDLHLVAGRSVYLSNAGYPCFSTVNRRNIHLGLFETREAAAAARLDAERLYYPELTPR